jgi:lactate racemase
MPRVAYGDQHLEFTPGPDDHLLDIMPADDRPDVDPREIAQSLRSAGFDTFLTHGRPLVVVNDAFRPTPNGKVLSQIKNFYPDFNADFIIACGNHPAPGDAEIRKIFDGFPLPADAKIYSHNSRDLDSMTEVGKLDGHPLYINKRVFEYPAVIVIGSVEPHYFAGLTGGRKSLVPGLADIESTRRNHALAVSMDAQPLRIAGNPLAEHLDRLLGLIRLPHLFSIQIIAGRDQKILAWFCGDLHDSFARAHDAACDVYSRALDRKFDLVIAEVHYPIDRNLYQMQKSIENNASVVKDGGTILAISKCREGIGNDEFYKLAKELGNKETVLAKSRQPSPPLGIHKLSRIVEMSRRINVKALTGLAPEILRQVFIEPVLSIDDEIRAIRKDLKTGLAILLVRDAGLLVTTLK